MTFPNKLSVTIPARQKEAHFLASIGEVFHEWIRSSFLDDILVDVADYGHVAGGPGVILIGHRCNYQVKTSEEGSLQVTCSQKRPYLSLGCPLAQTFTRAVVVGRRLEEDTGRRGLFDCSRAIVSSRDRLSLTGPIFSEEEFAWHVRQSLSQELLSAPRVRVLRAGAFPEVEATWATESTAEGLPARGERVASFSSLTSAESQEGVSAS